MFNLTQEYVPTRLGQQADHVDQSGFMGHGPLVACFVAYMGQSLLGAIR
jgi:hypothetical protein